MITVSSQLPYIKTSVEAAKTLVDQLNPSDRMAIVTDDVELLVDFTQNKTLLKQELDSLKQSALSGKVGRSQQYHALLVTLNELFMQTDLRRIIIFQTDGDELGTAPGGRIPRRHGTEISFGFADILTAAEKARATVYAIIPGTRFVGLSGDEQLKRANEEWANRTRDNAIALGQRPPAPQSGKMLNFRLLAYLESTLGFQLALTELAKRTGGWSDYLEQPDQANAVYARILSSINDRYVIGYYPTNRTRDGKRRSVSIEVRGHPEYIIWGRKTYFAPEP